MNFKTHALLLLLGSVFSMDARAEMFLEVVALKSYFGTNGLGFFLQPESNEFEALLKCPGVQVRRFPLLALAPGVPATAQSWTSDIFPPEGVPADVLLDSCTGKVGYAISAEITDAREGMPEVKYDFRMQDRVGTAVEYVRPPGRFRVTPTWTCPRQKAQLRVLIGRWHVMAGAVADVRHPEPTWGFGIRLLTSTNANKAVEGTAR